jgi:hypothetical protein
MSMLVEFRQHVVFSEFDQQSTKTIASKGLNVNPTVVIGFLASAVLNRLSTT